MKLASIDLGTNTVLLLIADWDGKNLKILRDEARITRLGEGLHREPHFLPEAEERTLRVLKEYASLARASDAQKILAVGTAAFRKAKNAADFGGRVRKETGIPIRIISGEEEARLSYLSVEKDFSHLGNVTALDIGGGSTEIISKDGGVSLDLGAVVLAESIIKHDPVTEEEVFAIRQKIDSIIAGRVLSLREGFVGGLNRRQQPFLVPPGLLVGLAGSVTTLSAIKQKLPVWDGARVQGSVLTLEDIDKMISLFRKRQTPKNRGFRAW